LTCFKRIGRRVDARAGHHYEGDQGAVALFYVGFERRRAFFLVRLCDGGIALARTVGNRQDRDDAIFWRLGRAAFDR
jgi:hypothetical protein